MTATSVGTLDRAATLRRRAGRRVRSCGAAVVAMAFALASVTREGHAQFTVQSVLTSTVLVLALRPLDFAIVLPGIAKTVDAVDPHGGVLELRTDPTRQVRIALTLPGVILSTGGVFLPVAYGTSDAILATSFNPSIGTRFDPNAPRVACANPSTGSIFLFLGGRVLPRPTQRRGQYAGTVIANVTYTGVAC